MTEHAVAQKGITPSASAPMQSAVLQRKCACGNHTVAGGECAECSKKKRLGLQTRLKVNEPGDIYEHEADRIADQVMVAPAHHAVSGASPRIQRFSGQSNDSMNAAPASVDQALASPGRPLEPALRQDMEQRFGHDFSRVRVHSGGAAEQSARDVNAHAYTVGHDIVLGADKFSRGTHEGRRLIAHELTHVVHQGETGEPGVLQRQPLPGGPILGSGESRDNQKGKAWTGAPAACGPDFCRPFSSVNAAWNDRNYKWPFFELGIAYKVSRRVVPLWDRWAYGGSGSVMNLTKDFGADFARSPTTAKTTEFLLNSIKAKLTASTPTIPPAASFLKLDIPTLIPADVNAINDPSSPNQMNFNVIGDVPGNIAGGIGKDQAATPIGANPSPQNDERIAKGDVTVFDVGASLAVFPKLSYTVKDTIDLCPGNCGAKQEQRATIPMSRWEATGISGDVPFTVDFLAPSFPGLPFFVPKPAAPAAPP